LDFNSTQKDTRKIQILQKLLSQKAELSLKKIFDFFIKCGARGYLVGTAIMKNENIEQTVRGLVNSI
jgi:Indole-3-glycerol phosphate synthase